MKHEESKLQQQCVAWFRAQYPQYAMLLTHPANEGGAGTRISGAIHKGEGTVAGVPDLLLFLPSLYEGFCFGCLGIELKTETGRQSQQQKDFERFFHAASNIYLVIRSFDEFRNAVTKWMHGVSAEVKYNVEAVSSAISQEQRQRDVARFKKIIRQTSITRTTKR